MLGSKNNSVVSFRTQLIYKLIPIILIPLITIAIFSYEISFNALRTRSLKDVERIASLVNENLDYLIKDTEQLTKSVLYDQSIQRIISNYDKDRDYVEPNDNEKVQIYLRKMLVENISVRSIFIYTKGNTVLGESLYGDLPSSEWKNEEWYYRAMNARDKAIIIPSHFIDRRFQNYSKSKDTVFSIARQIKNTDTFDIIGVIVFNIDLSSIDRVIKISQLNSEARFLILDKDNWVYPEENKDFRQNSESIVDIRNAINKHKNNIELGNTSYFLSSNTSAYSGWTVISLVPEAMITKDVRYIKLMTIIVIVITLFFIITLFYYLATAISKPVTRLRNIMKHVETGNLDIYYNAKGHGEIEELGRAFNRMLERLKQLIQDNLNAQLQRQVAELAALQNQLNPHFIYNTLEAFQMIAITEGSGRLARMSYSLGQLMRTALDVKEFSTIGQELEHVRNYLVLIKERYEDRLNYNIFAQEELLAFSIPKLTLQPLVENAVYHGLDKKIGPGNVHIDVYRSDDIILMEIKDDGVGIPAGRLQDLQTDLEKEENVLQKKESIGIANTQMRIKRIYGKSYGISIASVVDMGTVVTVRIPVNN